jgi:hypothetical protein
MRKQMVVEEKPPTIEMKVVISGKTIPTRQVKERNRVETTMFSF